MPFALVRLCSPQFAKGTYLRHELQIRASVCPSTWFGCAYHRSLRELGYGTNCKFAPAFASDISVRCTFKLTTIGQNSIDITGALHLKTEAERGDNL
jgi:hypothetical protein